MCRQQVSLAVEGCRDALVRLRPMRRALSPRPPENGRNGESGHGRAAARGAPRRYWTNSYVREGRAPLTTTFTTGRLPPLKATGRRKMCSGNALRREIASRREGWVVKVCWRTSNIERRTLATLQPFEAGHHPSLSRWGHDFALRLEPRRFRPQSCAPPRPCGCPARRGRKLAGRFGLVQNHRSTGTSPSRGVRGNSFTRRKCYKHFQKSPCRTIVLNGSAPCIAPHAQPRNAGKGKKVGRQSLAARSAQRGCQTRNGRGRDIPLRTWNRRRGRT